jgi:transcription elongation factor Elf1
MERFPDHKSCIEYLENIRWGDNPYCPHCGSVDVYQKLDGTRVGRWHCKDCHASFNVLAKTLFQGTHVPLQKWFLAIRVVSRHQSDDECEEEPIQLSACPRFGNQSEDRMVYASPYSC